MAIAEAEAATTESIASRQLSRRGRPVPAALPGDLRDPWTL